MIPGVHTLLKLDRHAHDDFRPLRSPGRKTPNEFTGRQRSVALSTSPMVHR
jgi:hypothetical protein